MINLVCDSKSWAELLGQIKEKDRFSKPSQYDQDLLDNHGRPLLVVVGKIEFHIYPPSRS